MTTVVLLGAGASNGSGDVHPHPPPLGNGPDGLFTHLERAGGVATRIPDDLKREFRTNFELGMARYYEYTQWDTLTFQRELAALLAQFTPGPSNAYVDLLRRLGHREIVYSTLNYDLLLEIASARHLKRGLVYSLEGPPEMARLLKPHGSCNFWPDLPDETFRGYRSVGNRGGDFAGPVKPLNQGDTLARCRTDDSLAPAMALYTEGKSVRVCEAYVLEQQRRWRQAVFGAARILVAGVRVHQVDKHIWGALAESPAPIHYYGLSGDRADFLKWQADYRKANAEFTEACFADSVPLMCRAVGRVS